MFSQNNETPGVSPSQTPPSSTPPSSGVEKKNKKKFIWILLLLVIVALGAVVAYFYLYGQQEEKNNTANVLQNAFGENAQKIGANTCAPLFSELGERIAQGSQFSFLPFWNAVEPEKHAVFALTGHVYAEENMRGVGMVYAAPVAGKCEGAMMRTVVTNTSCLTIANNALAQGITRQQDFSGIANFMTKSGTRIMLIPVTDSNCVIVSAFGAGGN